MNIYVVLEYDDDYEFRNIRLVKAFRNYEDALNFVNKFDINEDDSGVEYVSLSDSLYDVHLVDGFTRMAIVKVSLKTRDERLAYGL